ncbi:MAG TPA: DUF2683 family protein [Thermoplasmata archaeon]|nr:DUF2683 family protein [Thermoplasmata archaeon]
MVKAIVEISEKGNRILNLIKAKFGLRTKSDALNKILEEYESELLEPGLKPEFIEEIKRVQEKDEFEEVKEFKKHYEIE